MSKELYDRMGRERIVHGDLFEHQVIAVPVKTGGRWYGSISRRAVRVGVIIPELRLGDARIIKHDGRTYVCVAFWGDDSPYTEAHISRCVCTVVTCAVHAGLPEVSIPLLGERDRTRFIAAMERGVELAEDALDRLGLTLPRVRFVTDRLTA